MALSNKRKKVKHSEKKKIISTNCLNPVRKMFPSYPTVAQSVTKIRKTIVFNIMLLPWENTACPQY